MKPRSPTDSEQPTIASLGQSGGPLRLPSAWLWLVDETIPSIVKSRYSPRESWKDKPFSKEDARFFFKGVNELSELFTEERSRRSPEYFRHPRFRSSYLLYFLPLQAAKFITLFQLHPGALEAAIKHAEKTGILRVVDLGAGPGTASIALLMMLLDPPPALKALAQDRKIKIELEWWDTDRLVMEDGRELAERLAGGFPALRDRVEIRTNVGPWWAAAERGLPEASLTLLGHVLNESSGPSSDLQGPQLARVWSGLLARAGGGGTLIVEPAMRRASQLLSKIRDHLYESELLEPVPPWGPCLHAGRCPMSEGRDWCHFSVPLKIPGEWFLEFSKGLGSERNWLKFSYLWIASREFPGPVASSNVRRVISDPLRATGPGASTRGVVAREGVEVLICEPETAGRTRIHGAASARVGRGDLIEI